MEPLDEDWRATLDAIARARGWPTTAEPAKLGAHVAALSAAYNASDAERPRVSDAAALAARLLFSFARDVPKAAAAVRELAPSLGAVHAGRRVRLLDVGAGLGATSWGVARGLRRSGVEGVDATLLDRDGAALELAAAIADARAARGDRAVSVAGARRATAEEARAVAVAAGGPFDVVTLGQVVSELHRDVPVADRVARHAAWIAELLDRAVADDGALVVIEPALRERTRHLHAVRDALVALGARPFAPCLHARACPMLAREGDWCHEDLPIDLPGWLVPVARAAGLRWQGLTFAYLVLRKDGRSLTEALPATSAKRLRVVSDRIVTKGKSEVVFCGEDGELLRTRRLDRDAAPGNGAWDTLARGELVELDPTVPRLPKDGRAARIDAGPLRRT